MIRYSEEWHRSNGHSTGITHRSNRDFGAKYLSVLDDPILHNDVKFQKRPRDLLSAGRTDALFDQASDYTSDQ
jgi:hypothetical protein